MGPRKLQQYAESGGNVVILSTMPPEFEVAPFVRTTPDLRGYIRINLHGTFKYARSTRAIPLTRVRGTVEFTVPHLHDYELIVLYR